jgi:pSer/pThr/pTyr-binding forkhead associated (FHA) protein
MSEFTFIEQKPNQGAEHAVESGNTIGREGCDITIADPDVSRRHAAIQIVGEELSIEDLGSTNGTLVNGEAITARRSLREGDEVQIGSTVWRLRAPAGATRLTERPSAPASQATTLRPAATPEPAAPEPATAEAPAPESAPPAAPPPSAPRVPEPRAPEPAAPEEPSTPAYEPARAAAPAGKPAPSRRGDVPQPDFAPSGIRRIVPVDVPTAFTPETQAGRKGSAATRAGASAMATLIVALTAAGVVLYYITEPFK